MMPLFEPDICNTPSPLFMGLPATLQNLPFVRRHAAGVGGVVASDVLLDTAIEI